MEKYINLDMAFRQKPEIINVARELEAYFKQRTLSQKPDTKTYDEMYDFVKAKTNALLGISYLPLSKLERRTASKLHDVLQIENIIHKKIIYINDTGKESDLDRIYNKLYTTRKELFEVLFSSICIAKKSEYKILNTFTPDELVLFCDLFEEEIVEDKQQEEDQYRTNELAAGIGNDDDETDVAATFYDKVIKHHEINRPIGNLLEDMINKRTITHARLFKKIIENAKLIRSYFKRYPEVFVISYFTILTYEQMNKAMETIFPEKYHLPDMRSYIDNWYDIQNTDSENYDDD